MQDRRCVRQGGVATREPVRVMRGEHDLDPIVDTYPLGMMVEKISNGLAHKCESFGKAVEPQVARDRHALRLERMSSVECDKRRLDIVLWVF